MEREQLVQQVEAARLEAAAADQERWRLQALLAAQQPGSPLAAQELGSPTRARRVSQAAHKAALDTAWCAVHSKRMQGLGSDL